MRKFNRRQFIKDLLKSSGIAIIATSPIGVVARSYVQSDTAEDITLLEARAWEAFYRRQYEKGEVLFKQLIALQPAAIKHYKGLAKIYDTLRRQDQSTTLFLTAHTQYSHLPEFYTGYAIALQALWMGNPKQAAVFTATYNISENLLEHAALLYLEALKKWPHDISLQTGLLDVCNNVKRNERVAKRRKESPVTFSAELQQKIQEATQDAEAFWRKTREDIKRHKVNLQTAVERIPRLVQKTRRELYFEDERQQRANSMAFYKNKVIYAQCEEALQEHDFDRVEQYTQAILSTDTSSTHALGVLKKVYSRQRDYTKLTEMYRTRAGTTGSAWAYMTLAGTLMKQGGAFVNEAKTIYANVEQATATRPAIFVSAKQGQAKCFRVQRQYGQSMEKLSEALAIVNPETGTAALLLVAYAQTQIDKGNDQIADAILQSMTDEEADVADTIPADIQQLLVQRRQNGTMYQARKKKGDKRRASGKHQKQEGHDWCAHYALAKLQKKQGNYNGLNKTLRIIEQTEPGNRFVKKMKPS